MPFVTRAVAHLVIVRRIHTRMNKDWVQFHLTHAHEALGQLITDMKADQDYDYGEYVVDMSHVYHHLNTAWNSRDTTEDAARECSEEDFYRWRQFPGEEEIYLGP